MVTFVADTSGSVVDIIIEDLPMPPSVNESLMPGRHGRRMALISTPVYRNWKSHVQFYKASHRFALELAANSVQKYISSVKFPALRVDCWHCFPIEKIWTKNGKPKKIDGNNRIKGSLDAVANLIGVDDCYFFAGDSEKVVSKNKELRTIIRISSTLCKTETEILQQLKKK